MSGIGANREPLPSGPTGAESASVAQLIALQKQIIELVDQNTEARRECLLLRQQVAREAEEIYCRSRSLPRRLLRAIARLFHPVAHLAGLTGRSAASNRPVRRDPAGALSLTLTASSAPSFAAPNGVSRLAHPARTSRPGNPLRAARPELRLISCPPAHAESR